MSEAAREHPEIISPMNPGCELDALIAEKVMGLAPWKNYRGETVYDGGDNCPTCGYDGLWNYRVPPYSTDIAAAWEIIDKLDAKEVRLAYLSGDIEMGFTCLLENGEGFERSAHAPTAPHAICLAALKAIGSRT